MDYERQWLVDMLRQLGQGQAADDAGREMRKLEDFAARHGIQSRDEPIDRMGGSPDPAFLTYATGPTLSRPRCRRANKEVCHGVRG
jgi:hypothetical protein